jgi:hypothetical protein
MKKTSNAARCPEWTWEDRCAQPVGHAGPHECAAAAQRRLEGWQQGRTKTDVNMIKTIAKNQKQPAHLVAARVDVDPQIKADYLRLAAFRKQLKREAK